MQPELKNLENLKTDLSCGTRYKELQNAIIVVTQSPHRFPASNHLETCP